MASKFYGTDQKIYFKVDGRVIFITISNNQNCIGILKIGHKNLFHRDITGNIREIKPMCVLDFYVHESVQRGGIGKVYLVIHILIYRFYLN